MAVWLLALAWQARSGPQGVSLPRRLIWVVNRRVVVDQATEEAERLRKRVSDASLAALDPVRQALRTLSAADELIGISTLRGQLADNMEWRDEPARPAVVVGTVDMIGSRLLFSGYGAGFKYRPLHAGFLGQDTLLVHDEAHLEPAFQRLIETVRSEQKRRREFRPFHVMALTATSRGAQDAFGLTDADRRPGSEIQRRIEASKWVAFHPVESEKKVAEKALACALEFLSSGQAILIFLRTVKEVQDVAAKLRNQVGDGRVSELTGTMRGYERDRMAVTDRVFARFLSGSPASPMDGTVYLVCTSAGEVGINMSAAHLVCDLMPFDSVTQRFGRVNRFGMGEARIEIVHGPMGGPSELDVRRARTLALLEKLPRRGDGRHDASPAALEKLPAGERQAAFTPEPQILPVDEILFDAWALTSIHGKDKMPGRPPVAAWLHGIAEWEPAQTYVAWREEVARIGADLEIANPPEELLDDYPLKPHELLRDNSRRVKEHLEKLAARNPEARVWLVDAEGNVKTGYLGELLPDEADELRDCTILLPPQAGALTGSGMLEGGAEFEEERDYDVADGWLDGDGRPQRCRALDLEKAPDGMRQVRKIALAADDEEEPQYWRWYIREDGSRAARQEQKWEAHTAEAEQVARDLAALLGLAEPERSAIVCAAKWHDLGKRRDLWQRSVGNRKYPQMVLAKSGPDTDGFFCGYRHELGSLIDVARLPEFLGLAPEIRDLVLHLIAAHHGRARPHFPASEIFDPEFPRQAEEIAPEVPPRFARLQRKYGRWGLAYLESLVRAADAAASHALDEAGAREAGL